MSIKQASRLSAAATLSAPVVGIASGAAAGKATHDKLKSERKRIRMWRGDDGSFIVVRGPKEKKAFDEKIESCLLSTGRDIDKVAESYEAELEKIAFIGRGLRAGGNLFDSLLGGAARTAGGAVRAARGAGSGAARRAVQSVRRTGENIADRAQATRSNISRNFQAGLTGQSPAAVKKQQALKGRQAALARQIQAQRASRGALAAPKSAPSVPSPAPQTATPATPAVTPAPQTATPAPQAVTPPTVTPAPQAATPAGAAAAPNIFQRAQTAATQRYNLGALKEQGVSPWFSNLTPQQKAELAAMVGVGAAGAGFAGGFAGNALVT